MRATDPIGFSIERTLGVAVRNDISDDNHRLLAFGSNSGNSLGIDSQNVPLLVAPAGSGFEKVVLWREEEVCLLRVMVRSGVPAPTWVGKTPTEIWAPVNSMLNLSPPIQPVGITPETMLSGPARTDRFGPSVLVFTAGSETVMLTSTHLTTLNNFFLPVFRNVAAGVYHNLIVKSDGSLWSAGNNEYGQLGNGTTEDHDIWVKVVDANVTKVYASSHSSMFLKNDGTLLGNG